MPMAGDDNMAGIDFYDTPEQEMANISRLFSGYAAHFNAFHSTLSIAACEYKFLSASHFDDEHNFRVRIGGECIRIKLSLQRNTQRQVVGIITAQDEDSATVRATIYMDANGCLLASAEGVALEKDGTALQVYAPFVVHHFILKCIPTHE
jgi:hypothetical protein